jgi:hypothetical protein
MSGGSSSSSKYTSGVGCGELYLAIVRAAARGGAIPAAGTSPQPEAKLGLHPPALRLAEEARKPAERGLHARCVYRLRIVAASALSLSPLSGDLRSDYLEFTLLSLRDPLRSRNGFVAASECLCDAIPEVDDLFVEPGNHANRAVGHHSCAFS